MNINNNMELDLKKYFESQGLLFEKKRRSSIFLDTRASS